MIATATMSGEQYDALPYDEGRQWELLSGELIEVSSPTPEHQLIVKRLQFGLDPFLHQTSMGNTLQDVEFALSAGTRLRPDLSVLLGKNWSNLDLKKIPIAGFPDISIEVISPSERTVNSNRKVQTYLQHGVQEVWQIFADNNAVLIYSLSAAMKILNGDDLLTSPLLPGWHMLISQLLNR